MSSIVRAWTFKSSEEYPELSSGMKSKREEAKVYHKTSNVSSLLEEDHFRSETWKEADEAILFAFGPIWGTPFSVPVASTLSCASSPPECYSFFTVVPCWERCDPLQPNHPAHISYKPSSVSGPELGPSRRMNQRQCLSSKCSETWREGS